MIRGRTSLLVLVTLLASGCAAGHAQHAGPPAATKPVWTSPAEPSPPGSSNRWLRADERQLVEASRHPSR